MKRIKTWMEKCKNSRKFRCGGFSVLLTAAVVLLAESPVLWFVCGHPGRLYRNIFSVLAGRRTWVGFSGRSANPVLPKIKSGVLSLALIQYGDSATAEQCEKTDLFYAKDYQLRNDVAIMARGIKLLSR